IVSVPRNPCNMVVLTGKEQGARWPDGEQLNVVAAGEGCISTTSEPAWSVPPVRSTPQVSVWPAATVPLGPGPEQYMERVTGPGWPPADAGTVVAATTVPRTRLKRTHRRRKERPPTVSNRGNASPKRSTYARPKIGERALIRRTGHKRSELTCAQRRVLRKTCGTPRGDWLERTLGFEPETFSFPRRCCTACVTWA